MVEITKGLHLLKEKCLHIYGHEAVKTVFNECVRKEVYKLPPLLKIYMVDQYPVRVAAGIFIGKLYYAN